MSVRHCNCMSKCSPAGRGPPNANFSTKQRTSRYVIDNIKILFKESINFYK